MIRFLILFTCLLLTGPQLFSQSKEDLVGVIKAISEIAELDPLFQVQLSEGPSMVIFKNDKMGANPNPVEREFFLLTSDDFWGFSRSVKIMTAQEADQYGIKRDMLTTLGLSFSDDLCNARLSGGIEVNEQYLQGSISLVKSGFDWEVKGKHIIMR
ncbi:MAG: hypothetical protein HKN76_20830 [Saprospiraceae bacterium]|nr:hypothetical protein [Saprospiraceae bacterium]